MGRCLLVVMDEVCVWGYTKSVSILTKMGTSLVPDLF